MIGIAAGVLLKIVIHLINGAPFISLFKAPVEVSFEGDNYLVEIDKAAIFSNYIGIKNRLESIPPGFNVTIDLNNTKVTDHSVMENLNYFKYDYEVSGGKVNIIGLEDHRSLSKHDLASRIKKNTIK